MLETKVNKTSKKKRIVGVRRDQHSAYLGNWGSKLHKPTKKATCSIMKRRKPIPARRTTSLPEDDKLPRRTSPNVSRTRSCGTCEENLEIPSEKICQLAAFSLSETEEILAQAITSPISPQCTPRSCFEYTSSPLAFESNYHTDISYYPPSPQLLKRTPFLGGNGFEFASKRTMNLPRYPIQDIEQRNVSQSCDVQFSYESFPKFPNWASL